jgi:predicted GH43/DUF377 family glycosyl hydrolase
MSAQRGYEELLHRHGNNPLLTAADWPYPAHSVFNAGATRLHDGTTLLLCRVEDRRGHSHLCAARSADGVGGWVIDREPTLRADPEHYPEELWGIEDPRITFVEELGKYVIAYTAFSRGGPGVALALSEDFASRALWPDHAAGRQGCRLASATYRRALRAAASPGDGLGGAHLDLVLAGPAQLGRPQAPASGPQGGWWDANKVGLSPPLIETPRGWLMLYHGVRQTAAGCLYRVGVALFALDRLDHCLLRGDSWIFGPEAPYERDGDVANVTFPCGYTLGADGDTINLYYGAADTSIALASGSVRELLCWLDEHGSA